MAAGVGCLDPVVANGLFADMEVLGNDRALAIGAPAAAFIQDEFGIDQVALVLGQPAGAVEGPAGFLTTGQRQLDRALGLITLGAEPLEHIDPNRGQCLHVRSAAAIEIAVLFKQGVGIAGPILTLGDDNVDMAQQQHRLKRLGRAGEYGDDAAFLRMFGHGKLGQLFLLEAIGEHVGFDLAGQCRAAAGGDRGVGFDHLLVKRPELRLIRRQPILRLG